MDITEEQACEILSLAGFCDSEGQLGCSDATMDLLEAIADAHSGIVEDYHYIYLSLANRNWYLNLPAETRSLPRDERPERPADWWKPGVTIVGIGQGES